MVKRYSCDYENGIYSVDDGDYVSYDDYAALLAENERLKSEAGYTAADIATAAADGFRDGVRSVDLGQFIALAKFGEAHAFTAERRPHSMTIYSQAKRLLALIDTYKGE